MDYIEVDGARGEGGGQILRTAVAFSAITRVPVHVVRIRAGRSPSGLRRQHVSALMVLAKVFDAKVEGAAEGSANISFLPGSPRLDTLSADMGTAASITLVLQAVVPAVALSRGRLTLHLVGGTDVPWSPTFDYFRYVVAEGYKALGIIVDVDSPRRGYYPRGGGEVTATIEPCNALTPLELTWRPPARDVRVVSRSGKIPRSVAERQSASAIATLDAADFRAEAADAKEVPSDSPGTSVLVYSAGPDAILGADAIGAKGRPAEEVGRDAAERFIRTAESGACLDSNLADMLIPLLALAHRPSRVRIPVVTPHLESGLHLAELFTSCRWTAEVQEKSVVMSLYPGGG